MKNTRPLALLNVVNPDTGEIEALRVYSEAPKPKRERFAMVMLNSADDLSENETLQGNDHRVLWKLIAHVDYTLRCAITPKRIAETLKMHPQAVYRSLRHLTAAGIIRRGENDQTQYYLNPLVIQRGREKKPRVPRA